MDKFTRNSAAHLYLAARDLHTDMEKGTKRSSEATCWDEYQNDRGNQKGRGAGLEDQCSRMEELQYPPRDEAPTRRNAIRTELKRRNDVLTSDKEAMAENREYNNTPKNAYKEGFKSEKEARRAEKTW